MALLVTQVYMIVFMQEDLDKALVFYELLGFKKLFHVPEKWAEMEINGIKIGLCPTATVSERRGHSGVVLQVTDMQETVATLKKHNVLFATEPVTATHGIMASCFDPSGNKIDFYQPTHEKVKKVLDEAQVKATCCKDQEKPSCKDKKEACC